MNRVLLVDRDPEFARAMGMACLGAGVAIRMVENLCDGVRLMLHAPVSLVVVEAALLRLAGPDQVHLFDVVAPGVPVVVTVPAETSAEERVRLEIQGFLVMTKPLDIAEVLAKAEPHARPSPAGRAAAAEVGMLCG